MSDGTQKPTRFLWIKRMLPNSRDVWTRIGLLLFLLCGAKLLILFSLRRELYEEHWRVDNDIASWVDTAVFYVFAFMTGANLWAFGNRCQTLPRRAIHAANGFILLIGLVFILLTFYSGEQSYLDLWLSGILKPRDIGWNLAVQCFFHWPFVAGWVFIYGLVYYIMVRSGKGQLMLHVTALFATAYIIFCLKGLADNRNELLMVDCLGVSVLLGGRRQRASVGWIALPWISVALLYLLLFRFTEQLSQPEVNFTLPLVIATVLFTAFVLVAWRYKFYGYLSWLLPFGFFGFLLLASNNFEAAANYEQFLYLGLGMPRYFLGEFGIALGLLVLAGLYRNVHPRGTLWWMDVINLVLVTLAILDVGLTQTLNARLDCNLLAFGDSPKMMWRLAEPYLPKVVTVLAVLFLIYFVVIWLAKHWQPQRTEAEAGSYWERGGLFFVVMFTLSGVAANYFASNDKAMGQTVLLLIKTSSIWPAKEHKVMDASAFAEKTKALGINLFSPASVHPNYQPRRDLNVVVIYQESTYNQYLSLFGYTNETEPLLAQYKDRMELFPNYFSSFQGSIYARFATFTGLYPVQDFHNFTIQRVPVKSMFEALHDEGYACSLFYSSFFDYTSFRDFLKDRGLDEKYDTDTMPGQRKTEPVTWGLREEETLGAIQTRIKKYSTDGQKFFLTYIPVEPHPPYDSIPERFQKLKMVEFHNYEPNYINELLYMDWVITSILDELKADGLLDKTLVVITADHGEMLGVDGGPIGHGFVVTPQLANVPLIIMDPDKPGYRINDTIGSEVDLFPTVMGILGLPMPARQLYQGTSLMSTNTPDRAIYLNSLEQYGIIRGDKIMTSVHEAEQGALQGERLFTISDEDSHTIFTEETNSVPAEMPSMSDFNVFQNNFLHNYSPYCNQVWGAGVNAK